VISGALDTVTPSSVWKPSPSKAAFSVAVAVVGKAVPTGATYTSPLPATNASPASFHAMRSSLVLRLTYRRPCGQATALRLPESSYGSGLGSAT
jgi:hypothetical protein